MNLEQLKKAVDHAVSELKSHPKDVPVLITVCGPATGIRTKAAVGVTCARMGVDWEHGQFRLLPELGLVEKGYELYTPRLIVHKDGLFWCPNCGDRIDEGDWFCRGCGQKMR